MNRQNNATITSHRNTLGDRSPPAQCREPEIASDLIAGQLRHQIRSIVRLVLRLKQRNRLVHLRVDPDHATCPAITVVGMNGNSVGDRRTAPRAHRISAVLTLPIVTAVLSSPHSSLAVPPSITESLAIALADRSALPNRCLTSAHSFTVIAQ